MPLTRQMKVKPVWFTYLRLAYVSPTWQSLLFRMAVSVFRLTSRSHALEPLGRTRTHGAQPLAL